jgi:hypothetical protein
MHDVDRLGDARRTATTRRLRIASIAALTV